MEFVDQMIDIKSIRSQFPILDQKVRGHQLIYLDNAATTQKPTAVIKALEEYYGGFNSNVHRGAHHLAGMATDAFEQTRKSLQQFINAAEVEEIIFTSGTTAGINLVAKCFGEFISSGDQIMVSTMEHHSNIVPWQLLCEQKGAMLKVIPINDKGEVNIDQYKELLNEKTKIVAIAHASNALGTINPIKEMTKLAHEVGAVTVIDGAQGAAHLEIDVQDIGCDFYAISAHKMYGPTGAGALYGKRKWLEAMPPFMGGGEMIDQVSFNQTTFNDIPYKFEAGTPNIADFIAFEHAIRFIEKMGKPTIKEHEDQLLQHAHHRLSQLPDLQIIGLAKHKVSVVSFVVKGWHAFDIGMLLDAKGIAVRTGHHCAQPLMDHLDIEGTVRASFAIYNTIEEIDLLADQLQKIINR